jgi:hypothetical protein
MVPGSRPDAEANSLLWLRASVSDIRYSDTEPPPSFGSRCPGAYRRHGLLARLPPRREEDEGRHGPTEPPSLHPATVAGVRAFGGAFSVDLGRWLPARLPGRRRQASPGFSLQKGGLPTLVREVIARRTPPQWEAYRAQLNIPLRRSPVTRVSRPRLHRLHDGGRPYSGDYASPSAHDKLRESRRPVPRLRPSEASSVSPQPVENWREVARTSERQRTCSEATFGQTGSSREPVHQFMLYFDI